MRVRRLAHVGVSVGHMRLTGTRHTCSLVVSSLVGMTRMAHMVACDTMMRDTGMTREMAHMMRDTMTRGGAVAAMTDGMMRMMRRAMVMTADMMMVTCLMGVMRVGDTHRGEPPFPAIRLHAVCTPSARRLPSDALGRRRAPVSDKLPAGAGRRRASHE